MPPKKIRPKQVKSKQKVRKQQNDSNDNESDTNLPAENENQSKSDSEPDLDPMADLDVDAPPEFLCPITMSIMKDPVLMPDGQTYEREAIQKALSVNPISPITREPMDMSQAKTNYALKSLIDKYIQDHIHEIEKTPTIIDPENMFQEPLKPESEIPITEINEVKLETFSANYTEDSMLITIKPQSVNGRLPVSLIAIIDTSGSMCEDATLKTNKSNEENGRTSRIQLVQYSLKTIISTLDDSDQITLITFSDRSRIQASSVMLTIQGKERVNQIIDNFKPRGGTNLWDGIKVGIDEAIKHQNNKMNTSLLVFTDGQPNIHPPMGLLPTLDEMLSDINIFFSISTFGYGHHIDASLLEEIAERGNGIYGYCPDASMVGTIFISYISNLISEISPLNTLSVNDKKFKVILYNGSSTNVMIPLSTIDEPEKFQINLNSFSTKQTLLINEIKKLDENDENSTAIFKDQKYRKSLINIILNIKDHMPISEARGEVLNLFEKLQKESNRSQFMKYLMLDLYNDDEQHGDIERALNRQNFSTWGKNYLFSLLRFHELEQCGNFRDMSLQLYGNENFIKFRKFGNKVFMNLPVPQRDPNLHSSSSSSSSSEPPRNLAGNRKYPQRKGMVAKRKIMKRKSSLLDSDSDSGLDDDDDDERPTPKKGMHVSIKLSKASPRIKGNALNMTMKNPLEFDDDEDEKPKSPKLMRKSPLNRKKSALHSSSSDEENSDSSDTKQKPKKLTAPKTQMMLSSRHDRDKNDSNDDDDDGDGIFAKRPKMVKYARSCTMRSYHTRKKTGH